jgi:hypothetical protein
MKREAPVGHRQSPGEAESQGRRTGGPSLMHGMARWDRSVMERDTVGRRQRLTAQGALETVMSWLGMTKRPAMHMRAPQVFLPQLDQCQAQFKRLVLRFEHIQQGQHGTKALAYMLIICVRSPAPKLIIG